MRPGRRPPAGFTLLETLLAVFLSAMLILLIGGALNFYVRFVDARRDVVAQTQVARAVLGRIAADLRGAWYPAVEDASGTQDLAASDDLLGEEESVDTSQTAATTDIGTSPVSTAPGLYGNQYQLQVDVTSDPHPAQYDALLAAGVEPRLANVSSDVKTIAYYVRDADPAELAAATMSNPAAADPSETRPVLIRRVVNRAQAMWSLTTGDTGTLQLGEQLLADEVAGLEFLYFDGLDWYPDWDSELRGGLPMAVSIAVYVRQRKAARNSNATSSPSTTEPVDVFRQTVHIAAAQPTYDAGVGTTDMTGL